MYLSPDGASNFGIQKKGEHMFMILFRMLHDISKIPKYPTKKVVANVVELGPDSLGPGHLQRLRSSLACRRSFDFLTL